MRSIKMIIAGLMALSLSACLTSFRSDVTSFHKLPAGKGEKVSIVPIDPKKVKSLEFAAYAAHVGKELSKLGYVPSEDAKPDLIVGLDYSINDGREKIIVTSGLSSNHYWNSWSGFGFWHRYDPFYNRNFDDDRLRAKTVYKSMLNLEIRQTDGKKLYEGRAESEGRENSMPVVVPKLVKAIFVNFPGKSGTTTKVVIKPEEK